MTLIFYDLHSTLLHARQLREDSTARLNALLRARYGGSLAAWQQADQDIIAHWDEYYADLNLSGDEGLADYYEGLFRILRARFRLAEIPAPPHAELLQLSRRLPAETACDAFYPDTKPILKALHTVGYVQGIVASTTAAHAQALLAAGGVTAWFTAPMIGIDTVEQFDKDSTYFRRVADLAQTSPANCCIVEDEVFALEGAQAAGMSVIGVQRAGQPAIPLDIPIIPDLSALLHHLP